MSCNVGRLTAVLCVLVFCSTSRLDAQDGFADDLKIPPNIDISNPGRFHTELTPEADDPFRAVVLKAIGTEGDDSEDVTIDTSLPNLIDSFKNKRPLLERYLSSSPEWRVFEVRGARYATRRWKMANGWRYEMHGYYSKFNVDQPGGRKYPKFQTRCTLGLSNRTWVGFARDATRLKAGEPGELNLTHRSKQQNSLCLISADKLMIEIFEQTPKKERSLTRASLKQIEKEAAKIVAAKDWTMLSKSLPEGSVRREKARIHLTKSQPGIYDSVVWVNPGEPGLTYLKAFEVTKGTQLSATDLTRYANERIGWSDDPKELFFYNTHFMIKEGDWDQFYAARFEVWFKPDSGKPERKLFERIFKTEGWMR